MWPATLALILAALAVCAAAALVYGASRWQGRNRDLREQLTAARLPTAPAIYDVREVEGLPPPVRRYFRAVLQDGQRIVEAARLSQVGEFRQRDASDAWRPFSSVQVLTTQPPGFVWDARIHTAAGVTAFVRDAYVAGAGTFHAEALGLITVADVQSKPAMAQGELLRYLAEAAWYPTALLPSQGVHWEAIDNSSARATLTDGATAVSLEFRFDSEGLICSVTAASRYRGEVDGRADFAPWEGQFSHYGVRSGMRIPLDAEASWRGPDDGFPYCRLRIEEVSYELALSPRMTLGRGCYAGLLLSTFR